MKIYITILLTSLFLIKGKSQDGLYQSHISFIRNLGLPKCFHLKYIGDLNLPTKPISEIYSGGSLSSVSIKKTKRFDYILLFDKGNYIYFGDSLYTSCIVTLEIDTNGLTRQNSLGLGKYPIIELFSNMAEICNNQIISLKQAKKVAKPYWKEFNLKRKESILKYDLEVHKYYWVLTGYKLSDERKILIDAITGNYAETWDSFW